MRARPSPLLALLALLPAAGVATGCVTMSLGSGLAAPSSPARDSVYPTIAIGLGVAIDLPHDVRPSEPDSPRLVRLGVGTGASFTGIRTDLGTIDAITGPVYARTDVTFWRLSERALLRASLEIDGPGVAVERDPLGALGPYDVPHGTAVGFLGGVTLEVVAEDVGAAFFTAGLRVHSVGGDQIPTTTFVGPELAVAFDFDLPKLLRRGGDR